VRIPLARGDDAGERTRARAVLERAQSSGGWGGGIRVVVGERDGVVRVRYGAGDACPVDAVERVLREAGIGLDLSRARAAAVEGVEVRVSARPRARRDAGDAAGEDSQPLWRAAAAAVAGDRGLQLPLIGGVLLLAGWGVHLTHGPEWARAALLLASAALCSTRTLPEAIQSVRGLRVNIDVLMFAAAAGAAAIGHWEEGAFLLFLFGLGAAGEHAAMEHARRSVDALAALSPETARVLDLSGAARTVPVEDVRPGDSVVIGPFERVPVDARVEQGTSAVDESTLTGESVPVEKLPGGSVFAGTLNGAGELRVVALRGAGESTLARVMRLVEQAQENKSRVQSFTERVERWYVPLVFVLTAAVLLVPALLGWRDWGRAFYAAMGFMTAASPCALAIGTPAAVLCGVARGARLGVLIKGGAPLETLGRVRAVAFDKTGTLTLGRPRVEEVVVLEPGMTAAGLLAIAAAVEAGVAHPLAEAVVRAGEASGVPIPGASQRRQLPAVGAEALLDGVGVVRVVKPAAASGAGLDRIADLRARGLTLAVVETAEGGAKGGPRALGILALADEIRPEAPGVVGALPGLGVGHAVMLTGDHEAAARRVAQAVGLTEVAASMTPQGKLERIGQLRERYGTVAMIGDGVNDAPALASASVGIAVGAATAHAAMETADVALLGSGIGRLPRAFALGRAAGRIVRQNLFLALGVIGVVAPLAALGQVGLGPAVLLHEGSTIVVVLNALRLLRAAPAWSEA
jgi:Cd2+/Zn2+-exporting ATPase